MELGMADRIEANYEALQDVQKKFSGLSVTVEQMRQRLSDAFQPLADGAWQGEGSEAFTNEFTDKVAPAINKMAGALDMAAGILGQVITTLRDAEERARGAMGGGPR
jgi:WXG100 family type VII secretion target